ncbi:MAG: hypothetical protein R6V05_04955 [Candidatus Brocadiia bacterium]
MSIERRAATVKARRASVAEAPPATGFYSWYYYCGHVTEEHILANARFPAARRGMGDDVMILGCGTPYAPMKGIGNMVRVGSICPHTGRLRLSHRPGDPATEDGHIVIPLSGTHRAAYYDARLE